MFGLNLNSVLNPANALMLGMGPAGIGMMAARSLMSSIGQQFIQTLGEKMGMPQGVIDLAQASYAGSMGDARGVRQNLGEAIRGIADRAGASPFEAGDAERSIRDSIDQMATNMAESREAREARNGGGGKSWLMAIAEALGRTSDKLANEMDAMSKTLGEGENKSSQNLKFGAKSQEFSQFFSSANTVIKTLGEALSQGARKQ